MIIVLAALKCEVDPLIQTYELKQSDHYLPFPAYASDGVLVIITGIGKVRTAAAVGFIASRIQEPAAWLNLGIAADQSRPIGSAYLIDQVIERSSQRSFFPSIAFTSPLPRATLETVDDSDFNDPAQHLIDTEASSFFESASLFTPLELVQSIKVVADNRALKKESLKESSISRLIESNMSEINLCLDHLKNLTNLSTVPDFPLFANAAAHFHFTHIEKNQLKQLLLRFNRLFPNLSPELAGKSAKEFLETLKTQCDDYRPLF